jgi:hypothetical protein
MQGDRGRAAWCKKRYTRSQTGRKDWIGKKKPRDPALWSKQSRGNDVDMRYLKI